MIDTPNYSTSNKTVNNTDMAMPQTDLSKFTCGDFNKGASKMKIMLWYIVNALIVRAAWNPFMGIKIRLLRLFGAKIGKGMVIKNEVRIKSPWFFECGDNVWLGEKCWIDNLDHITLGNNVCISQGALLISGNHDYTKSDFPYRNRPIVIDDGAWIGAMAVVAAGVHVHHGAVLTLGSVATRDLAPMTVNHGHPATAIRTRTIKD